MPAKSAKPSSASQKKPALPKSSPPKKSKSPKQLERLFIPGLTPDVPGYDGGIPAWLVEFGLTVMVEKNWLARPNDIITIVNMPSMTLLDTKKLKPGEEQQNVFYFTVPRDKLPDGEMRLGYVVHFEGGQQFDTSSTTSVLIKTDLPGGKDNDLPEPGHSELKFTLPYTEVYPAQASRGFNVTVKPYPNMHALDTLYFLWGGVTVTRQVAGVAKDTDIFISKDTLYDAGDSVALPTGFYVVDLVGNASEPRSADKNVLVDLDSTKVNAPALLIDGPEGYVELERLNSEPLEIEMYNTAAIGAAGELYDITVRAYPPKGGVVVYRAFEAIARAGTPVYHSVPFNTVQAAAGGRLEVGYVLRRLNGREDVFSKKTFAQVVGAVVRLQAPYFENYPNHTVSPIPDSAVVVIPWYPWRKPTDELTLILRYAKSLSETIIYSKSQKVGTAWPAESPVKHLIYREDLEKFAGYKPQMYFLYTNVQNKARSVDLNESLRQVVEIGTTQQLDKLCGIETAARI